MNTLNVRFRFIATLLASFLLCGSAIAQIAETSATLKDAFQDHFKIGAAINRNIASAESGAANGRGRTGEQVQKDAALVIEQFNQISPENDLKWQLVHPQEGPDGYNWGPADAFVEFGERHNMEIVGHTLVWHSQTPGWVFQSSDPEAAEADEQQDAEQEDVEGRGARGRGRRGAGGFGRGGFGRGPSGPPATRDELLERMREHIHSVVGRFKGKIKYWDVVNEALADGNGEETLRNSPWMQIIGEDFIAKAFEFAHEADPDAILRYNDYGLENPVKRQKLIKLITSLKEDGVPVHAIGTQAHLNVASASFEQMDQALTEMTALGLPIHVTELDINGGGVGGRGRRGRGASNADSPQEGQADEANQRLADAYEGVFRAFLKHREKIEVVTFWGANDAVSWRASGSPLLFDGNDEPKPAFDAVIGVARNIRIKAGLFEPFTDSSGKFWLADYGFVGGQTIDRAPSTAIAETDDPEIYLSERYSMTAYSLNVPNGKYIANLYFAETFEGIFGPNERVFSYKVQGQEFKDLDLWVKAGGPYRAYVQSAPVEVTNGEFRIEFTSQIENPEINAIELIPQDLPVRVPAEAE